MLIHLQKLFKSVQSHIANYSHIWFSEIFWRLLLLAHMELLLIKRNNRCIIYKRKNNCYQLWRLKPSKMCLVCVWFYIKYCNKFASFKYILATQTKSIEIIYYLKKKIGPECNQFIITSLIRYSIEYLNFMALAFYCIFFG